MDKRDKLITEAFQRNVDKYKTDKGLSNLLGRRPEFAFIEVDTITIRKQARASIDTESESFKALKESIREKGVIEPIIVKEVGRETILIAGERRLLACRELGESRIPACFMFDVPDSETLPLQLIENLQREDMTPLDEAQAYFDLFRDRAGVQEVGECLNNLMLFARSPERLKNEFVDTVSAIQNISGKSMRSVQRLLSLLRLPNEVKKGLSEGKITLSQGYVFASNLEHPRLEEIYQKAAEGKFTKDSLVSEFKKADKKPAKKDGKGGGIPHMLKFVSNVSAQLDKATKDIENADMLLSAEEEEQFASKVKQLIKQIEGLAEAVARKNRG